LPSPAGLDAAINHVEDCIDSFVAQWGVQADNTNNNSSKGWE
jgi:hypothetical protein